MADKALYSLLVDLRANTAQLQQDMDKAVGILSRATGKMGSVTRGFFEGLGQGLSREFMTQLRQLPTLLGNLADAGEEVGSIADSFKQLGGSSSAIESARKATLGMVSSFDLMKIANEGMLRGIPKLNDSFGMLADFAGRFANATGRDTVEVLQGITDAIGKGSTKALKDFGITIADTGSKTGNAAAAIEAFRVKMELMAPITDSVSNAHKAFSTAMEDAWKTMGIGINESAELQNVYRELEQAVNSIDWRQVGSDIASMVSSIASVLPSLKTVAGEINNISLGLRYLTGNLSPAEQGLKKLADLKNELAKSEAAGKNQFADWLFDGAANKRAEELRQQIKDTERALQNLKNADGMDAFMGQAVSGTKPIVAPSSTGVIQTAPRIAAEKKITREVVDDRKKEELKALQEIEKEKSEQAGRLMREQYEDQKALVEKSAKDWEGLLGFAFTSIGLDPEVSNNLSNLGSQIAAGMFSSMQENQGGLFGLGQTIAAGVGDGLNYLFGDGTTQSGGGLGSIFSGVGSMLGNGMTTDQAHGAGIQGPGMQNGQFNGGQNWDGWISGATAVIGNALNARGQDKAGKDNSGTGQAAGALGGAAIAGALSAGLAAPLGAAIGGALGKTIGGMFKWGPQNAETQARHTFANWMEDQLKKIGGFQVRQQDGSFSRMTNFMEGSSSRFNKPGWADEFNKKPGAATFSGLGMGLKEILGITEDVGGQIAAMLGENLANNVDNARHMVQQLGLSFEEIQDKLVEMGKRGEKTWLEIETGIQGAAEAFKPGLTAVGDWNQAMQNLLNSGAKGFEAIQSVRDIFIEAGEKGIKTMTQLREEMLKTYDPKTVDAFFAAANQRGVTSIEAGMKLDDRTAGGFVADMQAAGVKFQETGNKMADAVGSLNSATSSNTSATMENTRALFAMAGKAPPASPDEDTEEAFASGGIVRGPTRALMGEAGPEAILPLTRRNGKLGVSLHGINGGGGGYVVNIDARGAAPGVEGRIRAAIRESEERVSRGILRSINSQRRRSV